MSCKLLLDVPRLLQLDQLKPVEDSLIFLDLVVNGVILEVLIDSGRPTTIYQNGRFLTRNCLTKTQNFRRYPIMFKLPIMSVMSSLGTVKLDAPLEDHSFKSSPTVMESPSFDVILGMSI